MGEESIWTRKHTAPGVLHGAAPSAPNGLDFQKMGQTTMGSRVSGSLC